MKMVSIKNLAILFTLVLGLIACDKDDSKEVENNTKVMLFASNNSDGDISQFDFTDKSNVSSKKFITASTAADGVFYDSSSDAVFQVSRSAFSIEGFTGISANVDGAELSISLGILGSQKMDSPREMAVSGNYFVVADNKDVDGNAATPDGRLFIYEKTSTGFMLRNTITTDIKLWGITFIGNDLYAVADADNELAVYQNFLSNMQNAAITTSKRVEIEGITRTHGLTYDASSNTMVLTDIGSATNTQDDGGFHIIKNFTNKFSSTANGAMIGLADQIRVAGAATLMGNPVDVAYDGATDIVYIAEAGNGGGRILAFQNSSAGGNMTPFFNSAFAAASSVYLSKK